MSRDSARYAAQDIPGNNRHFRSPGAFLGAFFRADDAARQERLADAARRQADAINAERTAHKARLSAATVKAMNGGAP